MHAAASFRAAAAVYAGCCRFASRLRRSRSRFEPPAASFTQMPRASHAAAPLCSSMPRQQLARAALRLFSPERRRAAAAARPLAAFARIATTTLRIRGRHWSMLALQLLKRCRIFRIADYT